MEHEQPIDERMQCAVAELRGLIQRQYPTAIFRPKRSAEDPVVMHLWASVDLDDPDEVVVAEIERTMTVQIDEDLPLFVIPVRTAERVEALRRSQSAAAPAERRQHLPPAP